MSEKYYNNFVSLKQLTDEYQQRIETELYENVIFLTQRLDPSLS